MVGSYSWRPQQFCKPLAGDVRRKIVGDVDEILLALIRRAAL